MGSRASIRFKLGDEPALLRNLVLPIGDLLIGFGQTLLNDSAFNCFSGPRPSSAAEQRAATDRPA